MSASSGSPGISKLAGVLQDRMNKTQDSNSSFVIDFGIIQGDYSLKTDTFPISIPKSDYMVCRQLTIGSADAHFAKTSTNDDVLLPAKMRKLQPGDRVLIVWVQSDAIVIDIILPASVL
jgi:hypothetical protein